ncbi:hypothetical protein N7540_003879 [Penicillium herquei]|nr:hypothetical protein N7540_003879 [Penicillium herquei]
MLTLKYLSDSLLPSLWRTLNLQSSQPIQIPLPLRNTLAGLPAELLLTISDFLSPSERIILSLCNRRFFEILFRPINEQASPSRELARIPILKSLQRSLPDQYVCYLCCKLHKYHNAGCPDGFGLPDNCNIWPERCLLSTDRGVPSSATYEMEWFPLGPSTGGFFKLSFSHVRLTMRSF